MSTINNDPTISPIPDVVKPPYTAPEEVAEQDEPVDNDATLTQREHEELENPTHSNVVLTFHERMKRIKLVLFLMYIVGVVTGIPSPLVPGLQEDAFGSNLFAYTGYIAAAKGFIAACYTPLFGAISDIRGRKWSLAVSMIVSVIPFVVYVITQYYIAYAICDAFMGLYAATLSLSMASITDKIPRQCGMRTESFAMCVCMFFLGMGCGPFVGIFVNVEQAFMIAMILQFLGAVFVLLVFPNDDPEMSGGGAQERAGLIDNAVGGQASSGATDKQQPPMVCPFGPHNTSGKTDSTAVAVAADETDVAEGDPNTPQLKRKFDEIAKNKSLVIRVLGLLRHSANLRVIAAVIFFNFLCVQLIEQLYLQYLQQSLNFSSNDQTTVIAIMALGALGSLAFFVPALKKRVGVYRSLQVALVGNFLQSFATAFIRTRWEGMAAPLLGIVSMAAYPCASVLAAASVTDELAGASQGVAAAGRMIAEGVSPLLFGLLLQATQHTVFPGAPFLIGAGCVAVAFGLSFMYTFKTAV